MSRNGFQIVNAQIFFRVLNGYGTFFDGVLELVMVAMHSVEIVIHSFKFVSRFLKISPPKCAAFLLEVISMKRELNTEEQQTAENILKEFAGYTVEQCEAILLFVKNQLKERAVVE